MTSVNIARLLGPAIALIIWLGVDIPEHPGAVPMLGVAVWMAIWWISECVPLALTALLPLILFPLLGIATGKQIAPSYINSIIFLFIGGFLIAQAMENSRLHQRIALNMLARLHASPLHLAFGFSIATAFLSMWISNTATTMLMITIALPLIRKLAEGQENPATASMVSAFLLVIAYSANIGGIGTPVGTPPNLVFLENMRISAPDLAPSFLQWMMIGMPVVIIGLIVLFLILSPRLKQLEWHPSDSDSIHLACNKLGPMRREEKAVAMVLTMTALLWMTRAGISGDDWSIPGWASLLPYPGVDDGTVAIFGAALLFLIPAENGTPILSMQAFPKLPWDIVILFGGGFALAYGMQHSGLSVWIGDQFTFLKGMPAPVIMFGVALVIIFLTEITSNTATTQVMLPILAATALANDIDIMLLMLPATIAASCAFMLPVATPPNAIIFGTHQVPMHEMVRTGIWLNLIMTCVIVLLVWLIRPAL